MRLTRASTEIKRRVSAGLSIKLIENTLTANQNDEAKPIAQMKCDTNSCSFDGDRFCTPAVVVTLMFSSFFFIFALTFSIGACCYRYQNTASISCRNLDQRYRLSVTRTRMLIFQAHSPFTLTYQKKCYHKIFYFETKIALLK